MTLLRSHRDDAKGLQIMARHPYPLHSIRLRQPVVPEQLAAALDAPEATTLRSEPHCRPCVHPGLCVSTLRICFAALSVPEQW